MKRVVTRMVLLLAVALVLGAMSFVWYNNRKVAPPDRQELAAAFDAAVEWFVNNERSVLEVPNPIIWYMVQRSAGLSADPRLESLFSRYDQKYLVAARRSYSAPMALWLPLFEPESWVPVTFEDVRRLSYYNKHFAYALHCDEELGKVPMIAAQNDAEFCGRFHVLKPTCVTHQLMGIRLLQRSQCGDATELAATADRLRARTANELRFDFRVVDVYIQRVMMLAESGKDGEIEPVWIRRVLDLQQPDGGWGNFQPVLPVSGGEFLGFGRGGAVTGDPARDGRFQMMGVSVGQPNSTFHATAQALLLLALLQ